MFFVYGHSLQFFFWQEDFYLLEFVDQKPLMEYVRLCFSKPAHRLPLSLGVLFRPLTHYVYFKVAYLLFGLNPLPYRLLNLLWHFLNGVLVARYVQMITRKSVIGFVAGVLFVINRVYLAPVYWITANNEIALTCFTLLSVIGYLTTLGQKRKAPICYWISCVSLVFALLSKESAVVVPVLIALSVLLRSDGGSLQDRLSACVRLWPHLLLVLLFCVIRAPAVWHAMGGGGDGHYAISGITGLVSGYLWGFWWNLETFVEPWRMISDGLTQSFSLFQPVWISVVALVSTVAVAIWAVKASGKADAANPIVLGLSWFIVSALTPLVNGVTAAYLFSLPAAGL